jgi:hypothetical protein
LVELQTLPQLPHAATPVRLVSQPLPALLSQLPKPLLQVMLQVPELQVVVPFVVLQALRHPPQLAVSVFRLVSQPLRVSLSQLENPVLQVIVQVPLLHAAVPFVEPHTLPQAPQFAVLLAVFVSQPLVSFPSQFARPGLQVMPLHTPPVHEGVPPCDGQALPQLPQF